MAQESVISRLQAALDGVPADAPVLALPFLDLCRLILPVIEALGPAFLPARSDVSGNVERLQARLATLALGKLGGVSAVPLFAIVDAELADGTSAGNYSCARGLLWLKRFLEFTHRLLERLGRDAAVEIGEAAQAAYACTLAPFHGWVTSALFSVVLKAAPYRATFERALVREGTPDSAGLALEMAAFCSRFDPLLARLQAMLVERDLDDPSTV